LNPLVHDCYLLLIVRPLSYFQSPLYLDHYYYNLYISVSFCLLTNKIICCFLIQHNNDSTAETHLSAFHLLPASARPGPLRLVMPAVRQSSVSVSSSSSVKRQRWRTIFPYLEECADNYSNLLLSLLSICYSFYGLLYLKY
jgi:hypothetical protein